MHAPGHIGIGLTAYVPASIVIVEHGDPALVWLGVAITIIASVLPDIDLFLPMAHRGGSHSIPAGICAISIIALLAAIGSWVGLWSAAVWWVAMISATIGIGTHLLADSCTPMGLAPGWPVTNRRVTLDLVPSKHPMVNVGLFLLGLAVTLPMIVLVWG